MNGFVSFIISERSQGPKILYSSALAKLRYKKILPRLYGEKRVKARLGLNRGITYRITEIFLEDDFCANTN